MILGHEWVKCEAPGRARQSFGQVTCHKEPNRHHSHILPLFRSHLTRETAVMFPLFQNPVALTEHECRDPHLPVVSHTENAEEEGRGVVLRLPTLCSVCSNHHDDSSDGTESRRQGRNHGSQHKSTQQGLTSEEEKRRSSQNMEEQSVQNKVIETAFRPEQAMEKMSLNTKLLEVKLEPAGQ